MTNNEALLAEFEDLLRTMPPKERFGHEAEESLSWLGRAAALIDQWNAPLMVHAHGYLNALQSPYTDELDQGYRNLLVLLHRARHDLRMHTVGPSNVAISGSMVFDYFDEIRKIVETAQVDVFFVDPYLDAEFISRYLPQIKPSVTIRLLARKKLDTLLPAAKLFVRQNQVKLEIRSAPNFHDRFVFVDHAGGYHSGSSFKDGAKKAPTTITQVTDAFAAVYQTYQDIWQNAQPQL